MRFVKTQKVGQKVVICVPVKLAILEMANCAQVKIIPQFVCFFLSKNLDFEESNYKRKNWLFL
jgi:hypothetical protein